MSFNVYEFARDFEAARGRDRINGLNHLKPQIEHKRREEAWSG